MNSLTYYQLLISSVMVLILLHSCNGKTNMCVFSCVKNVIKCKRNRDASGIIPPDTDCCAQYSVCFMGCGTASTTVPPCNNKGKRGSWNKRLSSSVLARTNRIPLPPPQYVLPQRQPPAYFKDTFGYLLDNLGDME